MVWFVYAKHKKIETGKLQQGIQNVAEQEFATFARAKRWLVTKRGYPDFICYKGDDIMLVEVKKGKCRLKSDQLLLMNELGKRGIKVLQVVSREKLLQETLDKSTQTWIRERG